MIANYNRYINQDRSGNFQVDREKLKGGFTAKDVDFYVCKLNRRLLPDGGRAYPWLYPENWNEGGRGGQTQATPPPAPVTGPAAPVHARRMEPQASWATRYAMMLLLAAIMVITAVLDSQHHFLHLGDWWQKLL